jgi:hypothetical protein
MNVDKNEKDIVELGLLGLSAYFMWKLAAWLAWWLFVLAVIYFGIRYTIGWPRAMLVATSIFYDIKSVLLSVSKLIIRA